MNNLVNAPPHLQRMLLDLQRYNVTIKYRPGNQMQLADALSHCPARASPEIKLHMRVDYISFTKPWIEKLKDSTQRDPILRTVYQPWMCIIHSSAFPWIEYAAVNTNTM